MPFPPGVQTVAVNAGASGYHAPDGTPYTGTIRFTPSVSRVVSATHGVVALGPVNATLGASGMFTDDLDLLATDASGFSPSGWTYRVDEEFTNAPGRAYDISLPAAAPTVALPSLSPVESTTGTVSSPAVLSINGETGVVTINAADVGAAPTVHAASHGSAGSDPITIAQSQVTGLTVALAAKVVGPATSTDNAIARYDGTTGLLLQNSAVTIADDGATTVNGTMTVTGYTTLQGGQFNSDFAAFGDLRLIGTNKAYRLRRGGSALDVEGGGTDLLVSVWSAGDFTGAQHSYLRLSSDAQNIQIAGKVEYVDALYGATRHVLDGAANKVGFFGAAAASRPTVTGSRGGNAALASALTALATLGLITDSTTA